MQNCELVVNIKDKIPCLAEVEELELDFDLQWMCTRHFFVQVRYCFVRHIYKNITYSQSTTIHKIRVSWKGLTPVSITSKQLWLPQCSSLAHLILTPAKENALLHIIRFTPISALDITKGSSTMLHRLVYTSQCQRHHHSEFHNVTEISLCLPVSKTLQQWVPQCHTD